MAALFVLGACGEEATYVLSWRFADDPPGAFSARTCGAHGVEAFRVTETADDGTVRRFNVLCGLGQAERRVSPGTYRVGLTGLDFSGQPPEMAEGMVLSGAAGPFEVTEGQAPPLVVSVVVTPRSSCVDGVDNDADGLVDGDDPGCQGGGVREDGPAPARDAGAIDGAGREADAAGPDAAGDGGGAAGAADAGASLDGASDAGADTQADAPFPT